MATAPILAVILKIEDALKVIAELFVILVEGLGTNFPPVQFQPIFLSDESCVERNPEKFFLAAPALVFELDHDVAEESELPRQNELYLALFFVVKSNLGLLAQVIKHLGLLHSCEPVNLIMLVSHTLKYDASIWHIL